MAVRSYDAKMVKISVGGIPVTGFADGAFVNVTYNEDAFALYIGSDGEGGRARSNNESARIAITLSQTSSSNDLLSGLRRADISVPGRAGVVPLQITDLLGRSLYEAEDAWVVKSPDAEFAREIGQREWMLETDKLVDIVGGNF